MTITTSIEPNERLAQLLEELAILFPDKMIMLVAIDGESNDVYSKASMADSITLLSKIVTDHLMFHRRLDS